VTCEANLHAAAPAWAAEEFRVVAEAVTVAVTDADVNSAAGEIDGSRINSRKHSYGLA
jgi:hypothetical protein